MGQGIFHSGGEYPEKSLAETRMGNYLRAALWESEERFRMIAETTTDMIHLNDVDGRIIYANPASEKYLGYPLETLHNKPAATLIHPDDLEAVSRQMAEVLSGRYAPVIEIRLRKFDGQYMPVEVSGFVVDLGEGRRYIGAILHDISSRKQAESELNRYRNDLENLIEERTLELKRLNQELQRDIRAREKVEEALRQSEKSYRTLAENLPGIVFRIHVAENFRMQFFNTMLEPKTGYRPEELQGEHDGFCSFTSLIEAEDRQGVQDTINRAIALKKPFEVGYRLRHKNGSRRHMYEKCRPVLGDDGNVQFLDGVIFDISDLKIAEQEAKKAQQEWEMTFDAIGDIITIQDEEMRIVRVNRAACEYLAATPAELIGKYCYTVFRGEKMPCPGCPQIGAPNCVEGYSSEIFHENLDKIFRVSISPLISEPDGAVRGFVHYAKDITERKRLEAQLQQSQKMEAIGTLTGGIAHDFNNILGAILGYSELALLDVPVAHPAHENINGVQTAARRAKDLVNQILTFSRQAKPEKQTLQVSAILREVLGLFKGTLSAPVSIRETLLFEEDWIHADATQMHQVFMNLCTNAVHAMGEHGGTLEVSMAILGGADVPTALAGDCCSCSCLQIKVRDTGHGIEPKIQERIFDPFFTTKKTGSGTGLGLSVVHGIVKNHGGMITVDSVPGEGAVFTVVLPQAQPVAGEKQAEECSLPMKGNEHILLVDDEVTLLTLGDRMLNRLGYRVTVCSRPEEALEIFRMRAAEFDLVITDQTMPRMTGQELAQALLEIRPDIPIILCSGNIDRLDGNRIREVGIRTLLRKPFDIKKFNQTIREVLDHGKGQSPCRDDQALRGYQDVA